MSRIHKCYHFQTYMKSFSPEVQEDLDNFQADKESPNDTYQVFNMKAEDEYDDGYTYPNLLKEIQDALKEDGITEKVEEVLIYISW